MDNERFYAFELSWKAEMKRNEAVPGGRVGQVCCDNNCEEQVVVLRCEECGPDGEHDHTYIASNTDGHVSASENEGQLLLAFLERKYAAAADMSIWTL